MSFEEDIQLSQKSYPYVDKIYYEIYFPYLKSIERTAQTDQRHILDIEFHIDTILEFTNGTKLTGQEKILRHKFINFKTFTIEFYQNRFTKEKGEFFNLGAQFYFHGYWNRDESGIDIWYLIKIFDFLEHLKKKNIPELEKQTRPSTSNASFMWIKYDDIPEHFIYRKS